MKQLHLHVITVLDRGTVVVEWLSSWLAEQEVLGLIPGLIATISEIGYLLLPSHGMAERSLKRLKTTNQQTILDSIIVKHGHDISALM